MNRTADLVQPAHARRRRSYELAWLVAALVVVAVAVRSRPGPLPTGQGPDVITRYVPADGFDDLPDAMQRRFLAELNKVYKPVHYALSADRRGFVLTGPRAPVLDRVSLTEEDSLRRRASPPCPAPGTIRVDLLPTFR